MSKYVLFFVLLISLTTSAQEADLFKESASKNLKWDEQEPFVNGFARVLQNNKFSFINTTGVLIHAVDFDGARNFCNHLAAVKKEDKWGFINESGQLIIPFKYDIVFDFTETITGVFANKRWWLIDSKASIFKALDITTFYGFKNGIAKINKNDRLGSINTEGEIVFEKTLNDALKNNLIPNQSNSVPVNNAVSLCPDNIDFEFGSFQNWKCFTGRVDSVGNTNVITVNPSPPTNNRHTLYNRILPSPVDPFGLFPVNPPDGSNFAVRLGNTNIGAQAERIRYSINVPVNDSNFAVKYDYAVVFEDPGHTTWTQPRFTVRLFDSAANTYVTCATFEYISTSSLPGFARSTVDTAVIYKPWASVFVSLRGYAGKTMFLEFTTADCVRRGHWGYAYVDVEKPCGQSIEMQYDCAAPNITTLTAPPGFEFYNWWNQNFTTLLGTGQQIILNPGPTVNSTIWVELVPFSNFGCKDTLGIKITGIFNANFNMSDTVAICAPHSFTFYNTNLPSTSVTWDFGDGTTGTGDTVTHTYTTYGNYIVKMNVILASGCVGTALKTISVLQPVGSFSFSQAYYCNNQTARFDAVINNPDSLLWDFGDGAFLRTLQTTVFHTYTSPGIYFPKLTLKSVNGCQNTVPAPDTVKVEKLIAGFKNNEVKQCGSTTLNFTDTSYSYFGLSARHWDFGDGTSGTGTTVSHTYAATGTYTVRLIITGTSGCTDTIANPVYVKVNNFPVVAITGDSVQCQQASVTFNSIVQSVDNVTLYSWTSSNGQSGSGNTFTVPFTSAGNYTIKLIATTVNGCSDTSTHLIKINPTPDVAQPADYLVCNRVAIAIEFNGPVPGTAFSWINNNPLIGLAASGTGNIPSFIAINNSTGTAVATITVSPAANGCPGLSKIFNITVKPTPDVAQPVNQAVCNGDIVNPVLFTGQVSGTIYKWTNNNPSIGLAASGTGDITSFKAVNNSAVPVTATITVNPAAADCLGPAKSFNITIHPVPVVEAGNNVNVCLGNTTPLRATGAAQYWWSPADFLSCINCPDPISKPADSVMYKVKGSSTFGCFAYDSVLVKVIKPFQMQVSPNDTLCFGERTILQALKANSYLWSPPTGLFATNIAAPIAQPAVTTQYRVIGYDGYNCFTDTGYVLITVGPYPKVNLGPDMTLSTGTILKLNAVTQNGPIISWFWTPAADLSCNNCPSATTTVKNNTFYAIEVINNFGCKAVDTIFINSFCKSSQVFIPNAFTPDGDGLNDVMMVRGKGITIRSFRIFNRWGELVFEKENFGPNDLKYGWDGKVRGIPATPDVFVYTAEVICDNDIPYTYKGNVTLLK